MTKREIGIKKRGGVKRKTKPVYLIIAEGKNKTETKYLSNFQEQGKPYSIQFVKAGSNTDAESLYKIILAKWDELDLSEDKGDRGFIVVDIDNDPLKAEKVMRFIKKNKNLAIQFVVSNPTFELWFLLHYKYTTKFFTDGDDLIKELKKIIPDYAKNEDCYELLSGKMQDAINNSEKLVKFHEGKQWPSVECNPRTDMSNLIKLLIYGEL